MTNNIFLNQNSALFSALPNTNFSSTEVGRFLKNRPAAHVCLYTVGVVYGNNEWCLGMCLIDWLSDSHEAQGTKHITQSAVEVV